MSDTNTVIEGSVKFRDGKKWKARWSVLRKLSPVADCLHLQLYRNSKDRFKQGQTKASLSLQHFLGVESGFTLDKESNTIAIICQDVTVVLAFDTRERLIQWQVKINNNLGDDQQFLIQIQSAPPKTKLTPGPARLHVQDRRFCMTTGVPPRLSGQWEIHHLRKYGVVDTGRFCFEGGSRCGKGEGLFILITDQAEEMARTFKLAAEGKIATKRRTISRNMSVLESPRKTITNGEFRLSDMNGGEDSIWPSTETRPPTSDYGDTTSVTDYGGHGHNMGDCSWIGESSLERCVSCISKLGAGNLGMSRSSTAAGTPATPSPFTPAWTMENTLHSLSLPPASLNGGCSDMHSAPSVQSAPSVTSSSHSSGCTEYSVPRFTPPLASSRSTSAERQGQNCAHCPPPRPPKPTSPSCKPPAGKKAPMPLPMGGGGQCGCQQSVNPYGNYDVPKRTMCSCPAIPDKENNCVSDSQRLSCASPNQFANYDVPPAAVAVANPRLVECHEDCNRKLSPACPCSHVTSGWLDGSWMRIPYCSKRPEPVNASIQRVKLSGEGKMPVSINGELAIYATVDKSKKTKNLNNGTPPAVPKPEEPSPVSEENSINYANIEPVAEPNSKSDTTQPQENYMNLNFAQTLDLYENARDVLVKAGLSSEDTDKLQVDSHGVVTCRHCSNTPHGDYLMMEPVKLPCSEPGYLPMHPSSELKYRLSHHCTVEKAASNPSLSSPFDRCRKRSEPATSRVSGSAMLGSYNESNSPYTRHRTGSMSCIRRRSNSADATRYLDDLESITERTVSSGTSTQINQSESNTTSVESITSQTASPKHTVVEIVTNNDNEKKEEEESESRRLNNSLRTLVRECLDHYDSNVHVRRSSSVPCKSVNRDSSSSNDSGVSTGSLKQRGTDFAEFELPLTTAMSTRRHHLAFHTNTHCLHASLPRKSKSSDPLQELTFTFQKVKTPIKSSSAEAEVPVFPNKKESERGLTRGCNGTIVDCRSMSSGTSDMSDYIETLSMSSHSSSDTNDLRLIRSTIPTLKPRSGSEYQQIDRNMLEQDNLKMNQSQFIRGVNLPPYTPVSDSSSPGYSSEQ
uniref:Protein Dok-7 n=1 Tax=Cacopsylla melanoneura TaxID=428564 RepID=A0A8D8QZ40_9HEMI